MGTRFQSSRGFTSGAVLGLLAGLATSGAYVGLREPENQLPTSPDTGASVGMSVGDYEAFFRSIGAPANFTDAVYEHSPLFTRAGDPGLTAGMGADVMPARRFFLFAPRFGVTNGRNSGVHEAYQEPLKPLALACPQHATIEQVEKQLVAVTEVGSMFHQAGIDCFGEWKIGIEDEPSRISFQLPHGDRIQNAEVRFSITSSDPIRLAPYLQIGAESFTPQALADISQFMIQREEAAFEELAGGSTGLRRHAAVGAFCEWHLGVEQRGHSLILVQNILQRLSRGGLREVSSAVFQGQESTAPRRFEARERFTAHAVTGFEVVTAPSDYFIVRYRRGDVPDMGLQYEITHCIDAGVFVCSQAHEPGKNISLSEPWQCGAIRPLQPLSTKVH